MLYWIIFKKFCLLIMIKTKLQGLTVNGETSSIEFLERPDRHCGITDARRNRLARQFAGGWLLFGIENDASVSGWRSKTSTGSEEDAEAPGRT